MQYCSKYDPDIPFCFHKSVATKQIGTLANPLLPLASNWRKV